MADPENFPVAAIPKGRRSEIRVALGVVHDARVIDVRTYRAWDESGELRPTKQGCSVSVQRLRELRAALDQAEAEAVRMGWMEEDAA